MQGNILDGDRWIAERLAFLRGLLEEELSDAQRRAVEDEIAVLSKERGITGAGRLGKTPAYKSAGFLTSYTRCSTIFP